MPSRASDGEGGTPGHRKAQELLLHAETELWASFEKAHAFTQRGDIGDAREDALHRFLRAQLPGRFRVGSGEVMDAAGRMSGQIDLFVYDGAKCRPLLETESNVLLPAEALLAMVEIKSTLTKSETEKAVTGQQALRLLRPWDAPWEVVRRNEPANVGVPRLFTTLFAYKTNLGSESWAGNELARVRTACADRDLAVAHLDRVAVLDRGLIFPARGKVAEPQAGKGVLGLWFLQLVSFLAREADRREAFPWERYMVHSASTWTKVDRPVPAPPRIERATERKRLRARQERNRRLG